MSESGYRPEDRVAPGESMPLVPEWAAPGYLLAAFVCAGVYALAVALNLDLGFNPAAKASGIVMLAVFALFRRSWGLAAALGASACGDVFLELGADFQQMGIAAFGTAQIIYLALMTLRIRRDGRRGDGWLPAMFLAAYGAAMWTWLSSGMGGLLVPASAYLGVILLMAIAAGFVQGSRLIFIGAILFVISDSILAARWFQGAFVFGGAIDFGGLAVWASYFAAQACLALGLSRQGRA